MYKRQIAIDAQCDIVPFMSHGEWSLWPHGDWRVRSGRIHCVVYPAIPTRGLGYGDRDALVGRLRELAESERKAMPGPLTRTDRAASP